MDYSNGASFANVSAMDLSSREVRDGSRPASSGWMFPGDPVWRV